MKIEWAALTLAVICALIFGGTIAMTGPDASANEEAGSVFIEGMAAFGLLLGLRHTINWSDQ